MVFRGVNTGETNDYEHIAEANEAHDDVQVEEKNDLVSVYTTIVLHFTQFLVPYKEM